MGKRSAFTRRPQDAYDTIDPRAVAALKPYLDGITTYAEPCAGNRRLTALLAEHTRLVCMFATDIKDHPGVGGDALKLTERHLKYSDVIITNPPWTRVLLHALIVHLQSLKPAWLLFDSDWAYNAGAAPYLAHCSDIVAVGRLCWIEGTNQTGRDNVSWYRFWQDHSGPTIFHGRI